MEIWARNLPRILPKVATSTSLLGSSTCRELTTWDRRLYFPSEERRAENFFVRKILRFRAGLNPRTWVPETSTLTSRPPKPINYVIMSIKYGKAGQTTYDNLLRRKRIACWVTRATDAHSECVKYLIPSTRNNGYVGPGVA